MANEKTQRETSCNCRSVEECPHKLGDISQEEINAIVRRGMKALKCHVVRGECWCGKTHTPAAPETPPDSLVPRIIRHEMCGDEFNGWTCWQCNFFTRDVKAAANHDGETETGTPRKEEA